jgi:hypothetical protein
MERNDPFDSLIEEASLDDELSNVFETKVPESIPDIIEEFLLKLRIAQKQERRPDESNETAGYEIHLDDLINRLIELQKSLTDKAVNGTPTWATNDPDGKRREKIVEMLDSIDKEAKRFLSTAKKATETERLAVDFLGRLIHYDLISEKEAFTCAPYFASKIYN